MTRRRVGVIAAILVVGFVPAIVVAGFVAGALRAVGLEQCDAVRGGVSCAPTLVAYALGLVLAVVLWYLVGRRVLERFG
ncbi:MAG: hypothetical protein KF809_19050 [Chloroflexi bacterium]|nr:hypothetical protein [Chloroflexota bacterium]